MRHLWVVEGKLREAGSHWGVVEWLVSACTTKVEAEEYAAIDVKYLDDSHAFRITKYVPEKK